MELRKNNTDKELVIKKAKTFLITISRWCLSHQWTPTRLQGTSATMNQTSVKKRKRPVYIIIGLKFNLSNLDQSESLALSILSERLATCTFILKMKRLNIHKIKNDNLCAYDFNFLM